MRARIGHGVDVMYEADPARICCVRWRNGASRWRSTSPATTRSSACTGPTHPFPAYRAAGVPTVLSTDDEGVERIDRTHELQRAVTEFGLDWPTLVGLERNTLEYAFVAGASLWADPVAWRRVAACEDPVSQPPAPACAAFLQGSEKARLQWALERDLAAFDRDPR